MTALPPKLKNCNQKMIIGNKLREGLKMQYAILGKALTLVLEHKSDIDQEVFSSTHFRALDVKKGDDSKDNLRKWFILALGPGWRAGPIPALEKRKLAMQDFDVWYNDVKNRILVNYSGQQVIDEMYKALVKIPTIGPKTANVLLRDWTYRFDIWPELKGHLYLPIDRHIRNIIINRLNAAKETEVPKVGEDYFTPKNQNFQKELQTIHSPRVEFDYFWSIGSRFCSYSFCHICWLNTLCKQHEPFSNFIR